MRITGYLQPSSFSPGGFSEFGHWWTLFFGLLGESTLLLAAPRRGSKRYWDFTMNEWRKPWAMLPRAQWTKLLEAFGKVHSEEAGNYNGQLGGGYDHQYHESSVLSPNGIQCPCASMIRGKYNFGFVYFEVGYRLAINDIFSLGKTSAFQTDPLLGDKIIEVTGGTAKINPSKPIAHKHTLPVVQQETK